MVVVPLQQNGNDSGAKRRASETPWIRYAAAGTLAAGGALLVSGRRRAGLVTAISGAVLAMIDQEEAVCAWWNALPGCLDEIQDLLGRTQTAIEDLSAQGQKLRRALGR